MKQQIEFKPKFIERYKALTDWQVFKEISLRFLRRSVRVNTLKVSVRECKKRLEEQDWKLTPIPWCREGFWVEHKQGRRDIGNTVEFSLGYYYVQEAASMIPPVVLGPKPGEIILDMCAAPGSKSSQIAQYMENKGILISNDYQYIRLQPLGINMQRMGITNSVITLMEGRYFKGSNIRFDRILVDAPCSGTGTIRKSLKTIGIWNPNAIKRLCSQQKQLLHTAFEILKDNGTLVYSTCSLEPEEDENVVDSLLDKYGNAKLEEIKLDIKRSAPVLEFEGNSYNQEIKKCLRLWPQDNDTEGFFVAKIKKNSDKKK
ncbi:RsmB/NOP family class I SAM-dependent RNA methyltransferase [Candidatus Woesearchaeota archaeon]|nr:RsmB/NOP family class I SAM-dependent RNA methyltransferase [Candidatus Woesearchaeota archaeon]